jgi:hypothetical protein
LKKFELIQRYPVSGKKHHITELSSLAFVAVEDKGVVSGIAKLQE